MTCCFPQFIQICSVCLSPCSLFDIKTLNDEQLCKECIIKIEEAKLTPDYKKTCQLVEKYKIFYNNEFYSVKGNYIINKWGLIIGDLKQGKIELRVFLDTPCFLCKGLIEKNKECSIEKQVYHYECSILLI
jgi:uncharacterized protein YutD